MKMHETPPWKVEFNIDLSALLRANIDVVAAPWTARSADHYRRGLSKCKYYIKVPYSQCCRSQIHLNMILVIHLGPYSTACQLIAEVGFKMVEVAEELQVGLEDLRCWCPLEP